MSSGNPDFYEHKSKEPALRGLLLLIFTALLLCAISTIGAWFAARQIDCPRWLFGTPHVAGVCVTTPVTGVGWNVRYSLMVKPQVRRFLGSLPPRRRAALFSAIRFYNAFTSALSLVIVVMMTMLHIAFSALTKKPRPRLHGTRFWATTEQVLATGLAVGYRAPWWRRFFRPRGHK